ncbi:MAG: transposase [Anaerolineales bacterium]|nr:MAG: transposase [Anaerolineales bacterium]
MPADLLVVTPSSSLGESIRSSLDETKLYRIHVVNNKASAIVKADEIGAPLALLDFSLGEERVIEVGEALRTIQPSINLIILFDENLNPPLFDTLRPWILIRKPFRMSKFMTAISKPKPEASPTTGASTSLPWLSDVSKAAQHLTRLTLESSAQAALITLKNNLWAYAGGLSQNAANEVAQTVTRNWDGQKGSDLLRFIRLESTKAEHMLYATRLTADTVLAFVFDAETPFSTIRSQASLLVNDFGSDRSESQKTAVPSGHDFELPDDLDEDDGMDIAPITNILTNIPAPNPKPASAQHDGSPPRKKENFDPNQTRVSEPLSNASVFNRETYTPIQLNKFVMKDPAEDPSLGPPSQTAFDEVEVTAPARPKKRPETPIARPEPGETDVTRENPSTEVARKLVVEPSSAGLYHLTYACLLVPRFSSHYLTGDVADHVGEWLPTICIAFGWRLEYLAVRPEYLQWVVNVQPNTSPGYVMRIVRKQTSEKIFTEFTRFKKENPSGDFWAPGYLIMGGTQPHPPQLVRDYLHQSRLRQGQESIPQQPRKRN